MLPEAEEEDEEDENDEENDAKDKKDDLRPTHFIRLCAGSNIGCIQQNPQVSRLQIYFHLAIEFFQIKTIRLHISLEQWKRKCFLPGGQTAFLKFNKYISISSKKKKKKKAGA